MQIRTTNNAIIVSTYLQLKPQALQPSNGQLFRPIYRMGRTPAHPLTPVRGQRATSELQPKNILLRIHWPFTAA